MPTTVTGAGAVHVGVGVVGFGAGTSVVMLTV
jgi:hypothetical protein